MLLSAIQSKQQLSKQETNKRQTGTKKQANKIKKEETKTESMRSALGVCESVCIACVHVSR